MHQQPLTLALQASRNKFYSYLVTSKICTY